MRVRVLLRVPIFARSSNGRIRDFDSQDRGSNPRRASKTILPPLGRTWPSKPKSEGSIPSGSTKIKLDFYLKL